ncbi:MAG: PEGA domain-containing protein [Bradymonadaceae bacterium]
MWSADVPRRFSLPTVPIVVEPPSASIYIDGEYRGQIDDHPDRRLPVAPGRHRVALRADGYMTRRLDVEVEAGQTQTIELQMMETLIRPDDDRSDRIGPPETRRPSRPDAEGRFTSRHSARRSLLRRRPLRRPSRPVRRSGPGL